MQPVFAVDGDCPDGYFWVQSDSSCRPETFTMKINVSSSSKIFSFSIAAKGTFYINWGDGSSQISNHTTTTNSSHSHTYSAPYGEKTIKIAGLATEYPSMASTDSRYNAFYVTATDKLLQITGSLGAIFPTIGTGDTLAKQPRFYQTFRGMKNLKGPIPQNLFTGVTGPAVLSQFSYLFEGCTSLDGSIPAGLFGGLSGQVGDYSFNNTFSNCSSLTGTIPSNLFGNISGTPKQYMFNKTFYNCSGLSGYLPPDLFGNLVATPTQTNMVKDIFAGTNLDTTCPYGSEEVSLVFNKATYLNNKVACYALNAPCEWTDGLKLSTGQIFSAFTQKTTDTALGIKHNNNVCYIPLSPGIGTANTLNFSLNNGTIIYHATPNE